ncbi:hypothetical protein DH2020_036046 [Rehmannia glutinosa]|uniref:DUF4005 domain-containing protein n=1 Tax=Rehmannia glutinosa TaxID=99300 RepID=A0ABR0V5L8_REHGL
MGKTGRWIRNFLTGKKEIKESIKNETHQQISANNGYEQRPTTPISIPQPTTPKEKRRWSFRRSSAAAPGRQDLSSADNNLDQENDSKKHAATAVEEAAAVKIQSVFRGYLARKALNALKGLVKLQALVRGHLVRKQATATLRCMQALVTVQARALAQRIRMAEETKHIDPRQYNHRKSTQEYRFRHSNQDFDGGLEENVKIVEMDLGDYKPVTKARNSYSNHTQSDRTEHRISTHRPSIKQENQHQISPSPSAITDISPRTCSNHFEEYSLARPKAAHNAIRHVGPILQESRFSYPRSEYAESLYNEYPFYPNYMANTESSRAKVRSHSAPKQRPVETFDRAPSRRRPSLEGRNVPRALDRSAVSLKESECGSTSTVLTNANYCRSLVGFEVQGARNGEETRLVVTPYPHLRFSLQLTLARDDVIQSVLK